MQKYVPMTEAWKTSNFPGSYASFRRVVRRCLSPPALIQLPGKRGRLYVQPQALEGLMSTILGGSNGNPPCTNVP